MYFRRRTGKTAGLEGRWNIGRRIYYRSYGKPNGQRTEKWCDSAAGLLSVVSEWNFKETSENYTFRRSDARSGWNNMAILGNTSERILFCKANNKKKQEVPG